MRYLILCTIFAVGVPHFSYAIEVNPTKEHVTRALEQGKAAAESKTPPSHLFWRFGSSETLKPHGMLMTKLGGVAVLSAHFSFRSARPTDEDMQRVLEDGFLQVSVTIFGSSTRFAVDSYMLLKQGERLIKPAKVRSDALAHRSAVWPNSPTFKAKVVASFPYDGFDPLVPTTISVFPREGGEVHFELDFSAIP